jgi:hypothetical protein
MLPRSARDDLERQQQWRQRLHERDLSRGVARVALPDALERKYPRAAQELGWQYLFASRQLSRCPETGRVSMTRTAKENHESTKGRKHEKDTKSKNRFLPFSCFRSFVFS